MHPKQDNPNEDWMQVLDNFLDNDDRNQEATNNATMSSSQSSNQNMHINQGANNTQAQYQTTMSVPDPTANNKNTHNDHSIMASGSALSTTTASVATTNTVAIGDSSSTNASSTGEDEKAQIRSQRKRHREKQRRSDVNSQFANLMSLLKKVEADDLDSDVSDDEEESVPNNSNENNGNSFGPPKKKKKKIHIPAGSISNRIDLIARTIAIMERLHQVNSSLRTKAKAIKKSLNKLRNDYNIQKSSICDVNKSVDNSMDKNNHMMSTMMGGMGMSGMALPGMGMPGNGMGMMMMVPGGAMNVGNGQTGGGSSNQQVGLSLCKIL